MKIISTANIINMYKQILIIMGIVATLSMITIQTANSQVPDNCGWDHENRCVVANEEDAEDLIEDFPDAIVEVNEELLSSIPEDDQEDIDEMEGRDEEDEESSDEESNSEDSGDSGDSQLIPQQNNFQPIPPGNENLPPADQSGAGLNDACLKSGFSQEKCNNLLFSDNPGGYCSTLKMVGLDCPKIQDPRFTYGNPDAARQQSEQQIENTEQAIQGFERLNPPGSLGGQFAGPGSTTNR
jgi:hypothetical protein